MASSISFVSTFYYGGSPRYDCATEAYAYVVDSVSGLPVPDGTTIQVGTRLGTELSGAGTPVVPAAPTLGTSAGTVFGFVRVGSVAVIGSAPPPQLRRYWLATAQSATNTAAEQYLFDNSNRGGCITALISGTSTLTGMVGDARLLLSWTPPVTVTDPGVPFRTEIQRRPLPSGTFGTIATAPQDAESYLDTTPTNGSSYQYRVRHIPVVGLAMFSVAEGVTQITSNTITLTPRGVKQFWGQIVKA